MASQKGFASSIYINSKGDAALMESLERPENDEGYMRDHPHTSAAKASTGCMALDSSPNVQHVRSVNCRTRLKCRGQREKGTGHDERCKVEFCMSDSFLYEESVFKFLSAETRCDQTREGEHLAATASGVVDEGNDPVMGINIADGSGDIRHHERVEANLAIHNVNTATRKNTADRARGQDQYLLKVAGCHMRMSTKTQSADEFGRLEPDEATCSVTVPSGDQTLEKKQSAEPLNGSSMMKSSETKKREALYQCDKIGMCTEEIHPGLPKSVDWAQQPKASEPAEDLNGHALPLWMERIMKDRLCVLNYSTLIRMNSSRVVVAARSIRENIKEKITFATVFRGMAVVSECLAEIMVKLFLAEKGIMCDEDLTLLTEWEEENYLYFEKDDEPFYEDKGDYERDCKHYREGARIVGAPDFSISTPNHQSETIEKFRAVFSVTRSDLIDSHLCKKKKKKTDDERCRNQLRKKYKELIDWIKADQRKRRRKNKGHAHRIFPFLVYYVCGASHINKVQQQWKAILQEQREANVQLEVTLIVIDMPEAGEEIEQEIMILHDKIGERTEKTRPRLPESVDQAQQPTASEPVENLNDDHSIQQSSSASFNSSDLGAPHQANLPQASAMPAVSPSIPSRGCFEAWLERQSSSSGSPSGTGSSVSMIFDGGNSAPMGH